MLSRADAAAALGVPEDASPEQVQRAFLRAARRAHPDVMPDADEAARAEAAARFDLLTRARAVMLTPPPPLQTPPGFPPRAPGQDGPVFRRVPGRGIGGSLVVLALLAFLLVGLVTLQDAMRGDPFAPSPSTSDTGNP